MKQDMIQGFSPHFGRPDKDPQVFDQLRLPGKLLDGSRPDIVLKLFVRGG
jgi:hypothetical protein